MTISLGCDQSILICVTGNGTESTDVLTGRSVVPSRIGRSFAQCEASQEALATARS